MKTTWVHPIFALLVTLAFGLASAQTLKPRSLAGHGDASTPGATHKVIEGTEGKVEFLFSGLPSRGPDTLFCLTGIGEFWTGNGNQFDKSAMPCVKVAGEHNKLVVSVPKEYWGRVVGLVPITIYETGKLHPQGWERYPNGPALQMFYSNIQKKDAMILAVYFERDGKGRAATADEAKQLKD